MLYFITHRHLVLNHQQGIENTGLSLINDTVCMADMLDHLFTQTLVGKDYGVDSVVGNRFKSRHDIRRYVFTERQPVCVIDQVPTRLPWLANTLPPKIA